MTEMTNIENVSLEWKAKNDVETMLYLMEKVSRSDPCDRTLHLGMRIWHHILEYSKSFGGER